MIGLSISHCCLALARGECDAATVTKIIARTNASTPKRWETIIANYKDRYWPKVYATKAEEFLRYFLTKGMIEQPRIAKGRVPSIRMGYWVNNESEIVWHPAKKR